MRIQPRTFSLFFALSIPIVAAAQTPAPPEHLSPAVTRYVKYDNAKNTLWLDHVRVIDGTGAAPLEDATVVLLNGKIAAILPPNQMQVNQGHMASWSCTDCPPALHLDLTGHSEPPFVVPEMSFSSPRLYLGAGVTTHRTTGSVEPYLDLNLRRAI